MTFEELLSGHANGPQIEQLTSFLNDKSLDASSKRLHLTGVVGSALALQVRSVFKKTNHHHLVVLSDKEEAAYFKDSLRSFYPSKEILFFPDSFKKPCTFEEVNTTNIQLRTETVNRLNHPNARAELIVTYPEALIEKVVDAKVLKKSTLYIKSGEKLDVDFVTEVLVDYSFEHVDFVYEPGQFSVRGGIIDLFSYANEYPYRLELFGDEVESIRTFDPSSQLSIKKIKSITIVPNINEHFSSDKKTSFLSLFGKNTIVWFSNYRLCLEMWRQCWMKAGDTKANILAQKLQYSNNPLQEEEVEDILVDARNIKQTIESYAIIESNQKSFWERPDVFKFKTSPQPPFNKNFEMLIADLKSNTKKGYTNFIFAENAKQIERFYHIFKDLKAEVEFEPVYKAIHEGFIEHDLKAACYTDHQIFNRYHKYNLRRGFARDKAILMKTLKELQPGDYVTHIDHGIGVYSGLEKLELNGKTQEAVRILYANNDLLYVNINSLHKLSKYAGKDGQKPKINKLGSEVWEKLKSKTKRRIKDIAEDLIKLYAKRKAQKGFAFTPDSYLQTELEASFIYEDTPDQNKSTQDVKDDMEQIMPMDRLVCGDVGFGKTEVAIRAAFKAVTDSKQVAVLVPTTILALQHYKTFSDRLADFPCNVEFINRFKSAKQKTEIYKKLEAGEIDILIGTHAIVNKKIKYKDLGLLIVDEEQKFGVAIKEKLKQFKINIDTLTLTATPIPRTLQFSLLGARDLSVINTPPPNRQPVVTEVSVLDPEVLKEAIDFEIYRGGQVFFVHNRIKDIGEMKAMIGKICPDVDVGIAHGQMDGKQLEDVMMRFIKREYDVLLCTNIIESGVDIPNANTIIVNNAQGFGLSDLHQLRGRVGRSNKKAFCYLFSPPLSTLTQDARKRLKTIEEFSDLGSGFSIAMKDLDIRGAGNLLGGEQSGFISDIGYEMYHKILDEAIMELKETEFKDLYKEEIDSENKSYVRDCQVDTDLDMHIPDGYVKNVTERMALYTELNNCKNEEELLVFKEKMIDRFGPMPIEVNELFNALKMKWVAKKLGLERIVFKKGIMKCYFIANEDSPFYQTDKFGSILKYIQTHPKNSNLKKTTKHLVLLFTGLHTISEAMGKLQELHVYTKIKSTEEVSS